MEIRQMHLAAGWYPRSEAEIGENVAAWVSTGGVAGSAKAAISPHAGWVFCGRFMAPAFRSLDQAADCVVIFGGHLPPGSRPLLALEDGFETPLGTLEADRGLRDLVLSEIKPASDYWKDNSVEVLLPMAKKFFPRATVLWLRVPNDAHALEIGRKVQAAAASLGRHAVAVGSTDLTHYGEGYGFAPKGRGPEAQRWVREENDARIVRAFLAMDAAEAVRLGNEELSACSSGAAAAAISFAKAKGAGSGTLLGYGTSADIMEAEDFVGYAAVSFP